MNRFVIIGLAGIFLFGIMLFAFVNVSNEGTVIDKPSTANGPIEPAPEPRRDVTIPTEPVPMGNVTYRGIVVEIQDGSVLTTGVEGIIGSVVIHLPENFDMNLLPDVDQEVTVLFDGSVAESYPMQIWATDVVINPDDLIPIPDAPSDPKNIPLPPKVPELPSDTVRITIDNAIRTIHAGMAFELVLEVNPTTGYRTELSYPDELTLESDVYISQSKSSTLVGAGSIRILQFSATTPGSYEIVCDVVAPSGDIDHSYTIGIEVAE
jgi:predicted secreted protein